MVNSIRPAHDDVDEWDIQGPHQKIKKKLNNMQARVPDRYAPVKDFEYDTRGNPIMDDKSDPVKWKRTMEMVSRFRFLFRFFFVSISFGRG